MSLEQLLLGFYQNPPTENQLIKLAQEPYRTGLLNFLIQPNIDIKIRKMAYYIICNNINDIPIYPHEIIQLHQLLFDENMQEFISKLIVIKTNEEEILGETLANIKTCIEKNGLNPILIKSYIYFSYNLVKEKKIVNNMITTDIIQFIIKIPNLGIEMKKRCLETIIRQFLYAEKNNRESPEEQRIMMQTSNFKFIVEFFQLIEINNENFPLFNYIVKYIKDVLIFLNLHTINFDKLLINSLFEKLGHLFIFIQSKYPIDIEDFLTTTILHDLISIYHNINTNIFIPFDQLFKFMLFTEKQLFYVQNSVDSFLCTFIGDENENENDEDEDEEEEEEERKEEEEKENQNIDDNENNKIIKNKKDILWKYMHNFHTLVEVQYIICLYAFTKYNDAAYQFCVEQLNKSVSGNIACFTYFKFSNKYPALLPNQINTYNNTIMMYLFAEFCINQSNSPDSPYLAYLAQNFPEFAQKMLTSNDPVCLLALFHLIQDIPIELINPQLFVHVLIGSFQIIHLFRQNGSIFQFLENCFIPYMNRSLGSNINLALDDDISHRRYICNSVYNLDNSFISAFKERADELFNGLFSIVKFCFSDGVLTDMFFDIFSFFSGNKIGQYISRKHLNNEYVVDVSGYSLFSEQIFRFVMELANQNICNKNMINFVYQLFINMQLVANNQKYIELVNFMYRHTLSILPEIDKIDNFHLVVRIFIKFGLYEYLDMICLHLCSLKKENINNLVNELSFILINQNNMYSNESINNIMNLLFEAYNKETKNYIRPIGLIFARVALSNKQKIEGLLQNNVLEFLNKWLLYSSKPPNLFKNYLELQKKLMIAFFMMFTNSQNMFAIVQNLVCILAKCVDKELSKDIFSSDYNSTLGLIKEDTFYEDQSFLTNKFISMSLTELIINTKTQEILKEFLKKYPGI